MPVKHVTPVRAISAPITHARWDPILSQGALLALCTMMLFAGTRADSSHANDTAIQSQQILAPDAAADGLFGFAMAAEGRWLAGGAKTVDTFCGGDSGAVYIFRKQADGQWVFAQKSVPLHGDGFFVFVEFYWNVTIGKL